MPTLTNVSINPRSWRRTGQTALAVSGLVLAGGLLPGCFGYSTVNTPAGVGGVRNPNASPITDAIQASLAFVITRYPPNRPNVSGQITSEPIAVSFPARTRRDVANQTLRRIAPNLQPLTPENESLPTYLIGEIQIVGDTAKVDVFAPVQNLGTPTATGTVYQSLRITLRGGFSPWRVTAHYPYALGTLTPPAPNYFPAWAGLDGVATPDRDVAVAPPIAPPKSTPAPEPTPTPPPAPLADPKPTDAPAAAAEPGPAGDPQVQTIRVVPR